MESTRDTPSWLKRLTLCFSMRNISKTISAEVVMRALLLISFFIFALIAAGSSRAAEDQSSHQTPAEVGRELVVYLDAHASTWRSRGRISFGIIPAVRMKLTSAGFAVTQDPEAPHDLVLKVDYREERGKPISINLYGTEISCVMHLNHAERGQVFLIKIHEAPAYAELVSAPYVEVVERFQANPYFYFLGDLIRGWTDAHLDTTGALIQALDRQVNHELQGPVGTPMDTLLSPAETFADLDLHFADWAQVNTVDELGRLKDSRAMNVLEKLMFHSDHRTRLRAVVALGEFDAPSIAPVMMRVVQVDSDSSVRDAAAAVLTKFSMR